MAENGHEQNDAELSKRLDHSGITLGGDDLVHWRDDSKDRPRNWTPWKKFYNALLISWLELLMTGISTAGVSRWRPIVS